jgi:hypothetical protein
LVSGVASVEMRLRCLALAVLGTAASALVLALPATAKEGVRAQLMTRIPLDAPAGTRLEVRWRLFSVGDRDQREPFGANGVFVRLLSRSGADPEEGLAPDGAYATGEYEALVTVPEGGIGDVVIGLMGWSSGAGGTHRGDLIFPIANDPVAGRPARASSQASDGPQRDSRTWLIELLVAAGAVLTLLVAGLVLHRRRTAATSYREPRASAF